MTNLKKFLSSVLALAMSATLAAPAFAETLTVSVNSADILGSTVNVDASDAEVETVVQPEVLMFRDYEDLSGTETRYNLAKFLTFNQEGNFGTTKLGTNEGVGVDPVVVNGADGQGLGFNTKADGGTSGAFAAATTKGYSTGKIYIAFDMQRKSDAELDEQDGTTDGYKMVTNAETGAEEKKYVMHDTYFYINGGSGATQQYGRIWMRHTNSTATTWNGTTPGHYIPDEELHRYEYVIDLDNDTFKGYVDGAQVGNGTTYAADFVNFSMTLTNAIKYLDNFAIVHYPTDYTGTFSVTATDIDYKNGALVVDLDSDTETVVDETTTYTANYPVVVTGEVTAESFVVTNEAGEAVTVSSVTPADAVGSYKIALEGGLVTDETYTVAAVEGLTDVLGATVDTTKTAEFTPVVPTVLYFRDYENYTTGGEVLGNTYGTVKMGANGDLNSGSKAVTGVDGTAVDFGDKASGPPEFALAEPLTSGQVYIAMDMEPCTAEEFANETVTPADFYITVKSSDNTTGRYIRVGAGRKPQSWEDIAKFGQLPEGYHRLEVVINLDDGNVYSYIDGADNGTIAYGRNNFNYLNVMHNAGTGFKRWDNFTVVYYPVGAENMFSLAGKGADYENNALTVDFDNDAATTVDTTTYKANYPTILTSDLTPEDVTVTNSAGEAVAVSAVNKNAAFGSYDLVLEEEIAEGETYTVSVSSDLESTLGGIINGTTAEVKATAPEVLIYRDYENYTAGADVYNAAGKHGSWKAGGASGFALKVTPAKAADGYALTTPALTGDAGTGSWGAKFANVLTSGKFYIGYDIEKKSDEELIAMYGETPVCKELLGTILIGDEWSDANQRYVRTSVSHSSITSGLSTWHNPITPYYLGAGYTRIEYVVDLDANMMYRYVNGELEASQAFASNIYGYRQEFNSSVKYFDNFTMLHIPSDAKAQTFSLQNAEADKDNNTITVQLKSDIANAAYPIVTDELTAEDFVVIDKDGAALTIANVAKSAAFGEYVITVEEELVENATYTVTTSAERTDVLGTTLDTTAAADVTVLPDVYFDYGFDGYTGVGTQFTPSPVSGQKPTYQKAVNDEKYGTGMDFFLPENETWPTTIYVKNFANPINKGKFVVSFDWMYDDQDTWAGKRQQIQMATVSGAGTGAWDGNIYLAYFDPASDGSVSVKTPVAVGSWNNNESKALEMNTMYHFDLVMDYDNGVYEGFVNGESLGGFTFNVANLTAKSAQYNMSTGTSFFDNMAMAYSNADSFGVTKTVWNGDYAEVLLSEGADAASLALADDVVVTDNATGTAVDATVELSGRRVIISGLDKTKSYTVTMPETYTSVTGNALADKTVVIGAGEFEVSVKITVDENGTELTAENKANLTAGSKVYAQVTYTNTTGEDKVFTVLGATYASNRMTDVNYAEVTALGSVTDTVTKYVELDVTDVTNFDAKAFVVDGFTNLTPIK